MIKNLKKLRDAQAKKVGVGVRAAMVCSHGGVSPAVRQSHGRGGRVWIMELYSRGWLFCFPAVAVLDGGVVVDFAVMRGMNYRMNTRTQYY